MSDLVDVAGSRVERARLGQQAGFCAALQGYPRRGSGVRTWTDARAVGFRPGGGGRRLTPEAVGFLVGTGAIRKAP